MTWNNQSNIKVSCYNVDNSTEDHVQKIIYIYSHIHTYYVYVKGYLSKHYCDITRVTKTDKSLSLKEKLDRTKSIHTVAGG